MVSPFFSTVLFQRALGNLTKFFKNKFKCPTFARPPPSALTWMDVLYDLYPWMDKYHIIRLMCNVN